MTDTPVMEPRGEVPEVASSAIGAGPAVVPRLLIVDDEGTMLRLVSSLLTTRGIDCSTAQSLEEARSLWNAVPFDLLLVDINLSDGSGLSLLEENAVRRPVALVMTGSDDVMNAVRAIRMGAIDFIAKPFGTAELVQRVQCAIEQWRTRIDVFAHARMLETLVRMKTDEQSQTRRQLERVCESTIEAFVTALHLKDPETADHCRRVTRNSETLGEILGLSTFELRNLRWGAYLHDIGKIGVPEAILRKPGALLPDERQVMERHPMLGYTMIQNIDFLKFSTDVVLFHHERNDGDGYPYGLKGDQIPLNARLFSVLDVLDAMTSDRPYRGALAFSTARDEIVRAAGSAFDPEIVEQFIAEPETRWLVEAHQRAS